MEELVICAGLFSGREADDCVALQIYFPLLLSGDHGIVSMYFSSVLSKEYAKTDGIVGLGRDGFET